MGVNVKFKITDKRKSGALKAKEKAFRREASRLASMANKRLKRMEEQNLLKSPSYQNWLESGGQKFGIRGKSHEEVKQEVARLNQFLKQTTSTVTGAKNYFRNVASKIGVTKWENYKDLQNKINTFFGITGKVKDYLHNSKEIGVAIGYQKIWEVVSDYVEEIGAETKQLEGDIIEMAQNVVNSVGLGKADDILDEFMNSL